MKDFEMSFDELCLPEVGKRLKAQRNALNMTREYAAELVDVTPRYIADLEIGKKGMTLKTLYKFAQAYNVSIDYIISGEKPLREETETVKRIRENILDVLSDCGEEELRCLEQITHYYVEALRQE